MDNNLTERIIKVVKHLEKKGNPGESSIVPKLLALREHIESGGIPGPADFDLIDYYEPTAILPRCLYISPLWECKIGLMLNCAHRAEWERGENTCTRYAKG